MAGLLHFGLLTHWELVGTGLGGEGGRLIGFDNYTYLEEQKELLFLKGLTFFVRVLKIIFSSHGFK